MSHPTVDLAERDRAAAAAVRRHHAQLAEELDQRTESLLGLVEGQYLLKAEQARQDLLAYLRRDLVPHALAEEHTLYPTAAAQPGGAPLVEGMLGEHQVITALVGEVAEAGSLTRAAGAARAIAALFATHLAKENDLVLPMLVGAADVSLADLLSGMHDLLGDGTREPHGAAEGDANVARPESAAGGCGCGGCGCGGDRAAGPAPAPMLTVDSRLDVRAVPHSERS
ncbi:hemerythrin domain-containing protein [Micromonospora sp. NPDC005806]|uniref:hemerythrin domain-containing protein n=1 Tax=Micromonospora sp. NPDC005806 TaxID=3364234 RepID=UPI0036C742B9